MIRRLAAMAVAVAVLGLPLAAFAQPASNNSGVDQAGQVINSWAVAPTGTDPTQPSTRIYLTYTLQPGAVLHDSVTLWNYSNVQLTFSIYPSDARNNPDGQFGLPPSTDKPTDVGAWVAMPQAHVTAQPNSKIDLPITITVPNDARPGDHSGAILASNAVNGVGADGKSITLDRRTGTRIYIRVAGTVTPALAVENVHSVYKGSWNPLKGRLAVTYTVRNVGNVRLAAHQQVEGAALFSVGKKKVTPKDLPELLPNNAVTLHQEFKNVPALFLATDTVRISPFSAANDVRSVPGVSRSGRALAIPWSVIVLAALVWAGRRFVRRRRPLAVATPVLSPPAPQGQPAQVS